MQIEVTRSLLPHRQLFRKFVVDTNYLPNRDWGHAAVAMRAQLSAGSIGYVDAFYFMEWCKENNVNFMNLFPDMSRSQYTENDTFIYAAPIETHVWTELQKYARRTGDRAGYLMDEDVAGLEGAVIILRSPNMSDDDCLAAAAYVRMVHNETGRIYCVPCRAKLSHHDHINASAGAPRALCKMVTFSLFDKENMENSDIQTP